MTNDVGIMHYLLGLIAGFLCGSIPCGLWITRLMHGIDIREYGSKNIGTTNVFRTVGGQTAILVLIADMLKGILIVALFMKLWNNDWLTAVTAFGAFMGHNYSAFLNFNGGKGVATGLGLLVLLMPKASAACFVVWAVLVFATRYVSLGSIVGGFCAPLLAWYFGYSLPYISFAGVAGIFIVVRHKENIKRLLSGTESKIKPGKLENKL